MSYLPLTIEPVPANSRLATLAKLLPRSRWDRLRRRVYRNAGFRCRICGREGQLHCHEVWQYNERTGYQWLRGFEALCRDCHGVKHLTFTRDDRIRERLLKHFCAVNRVTRDQVEEHLRSAHQRQNHLNQRSWIINFGNYNWQMPPQATIQHRRKYAMLNRPTNRY